MRDCLAQKQAERLLPRKFDEFENTNCEVELARLDSLLMSCKTIQILWRTSSFMAGGVAGVTKQNCMRLA